VNVPAENSGSTNNEEEHSTINWIHSVSYFFGGVFRANAVPHFVKGMMGRLQFLLRACAISARMAYE
jgi:hypothetical protein